MAGGNTLVQGLPSQDGEFDLCHVEPTCVLGRVVKADASHESSLLSWSECLSERFLKMGVQVVEHEVNLLGCSVRGGDDASDLQGKVLSGSSFRIGDFSMLTLGFYGAEDIASAMTFVFVISSSRFAWLGR